MPRPNSTQQWLRDRAAATLRWSSERAGFLAQDLAAGSTGDATSDGPTSPTHALDFLARIEQALRANTLPDSTVNVVALRVDHFDVLIAGHGAAVGGEILEAVAGRLSGTVCAHGDLSPLGADGFAFLWSSPGPLDPSELAGRIEDKFRLPIMVSIGPIPVSLNIGTGSSALDATAIDAPTLLYRAETALSLAGRQGRGEVVVFDDASQKRAIDDYQTERQLRAAVNARAVGVHYQPIINMHSGDVVGIEALARWKDDLIGFVSPSTFIPIAEESGLIGELGRLVLAASVEQGGLWNELQSMDLMLTVNLSNRQLLDPQLVPTIARLLDDHNLEPSRLCMEITESVVMNNVAASMTILGLMKDLGLTLAIDDFGTGYSSLSYLRRLPVDILKIDQSFVHNIYNRDDRMVTKAIIDLAHTLGMTTVAEGVETRLQLEVLDALDCDMAQGFLLHAPTTADRVNFASFEFNAETNNQPATGSLGSMPSSPSAPTGQFAQQ